MAQENENNEQNLTVFQRLNRIFSRGGPQIDKAKTIGKKSVNKYNVDNSEELLRTKSKEEYEQLKQQKKQSKYIGNQWQKVDNELYQQYIQYETARIGAYHDFESMEFYPEISATLDIMMEECVTPNDQGEILNIYSDSERVKKVLEDLFMNRLELHTNLPMWTRNLPIKEDSMIPLLDGKEHEIKDISSKLKNGEELWTYSIQNETNEIVPGKIVWCDLTRENSELVRVNLDDNTHIDSTPDHEFILRDGSAKRADELKENDSLMPFYTRKTNRNDGDLVNDFEKVYNPGSNHYSYTTNICYGAGIKGYRELILETDQDQSVEIEEMENHKVKSVEFLDETSDVYCMEVRGPNDERDRHNFPVCGKDEDGNNFREGTFVANCKYGDNFLFLNIDDSQGITGVRQLPNIEIQRTDGDLHGKITGRGTIMENEGEGEKDPEDRPDKTKFFWKGKDIEFNSWQIAHFRLLGDDRRLPYGTCLKYNTRVETENGYEEIQNIKKGDKVYSFDTEKQEKVLSEVLDTVNSGVKKTYKISTKHNHIEASKEHRILYYDDSTEEFKYKNTLDFKVGDKLVINKEKNVDKQIKINKDAPKSNKNGYWNDVDLIPDYVDEDFAKLFGYLIGDGWIHNDSVEIALSEHPTLDEYYINYLENITNKKAKYKNGSDSKLEYSQATYNSKMLSTILKRMGFGGDSHSKRIPNWVYESSKSIRWAFLKGLVDSDGSMNIDKWNCLRYSIELSNEELINDIKILVQSLGLKSGKILNRLRNGGGINGREFKSQYRSYYFYFYETKNEQTKKHDINNRLTDNFIIEPIKSIEDNGEHETYDIYVENENHNFYANGVVVHNSVLEKARRIWKQLILSEDAMLVYRVTRAPERRIYKIYVGNIDDEDVEPYVNEIANKFKRKPMTDPETGQVDLSYNQLANDQDYFIPVRDENAPTPIDTLPGAQNLGEIADIEFLQNKLFTALRVPKTFLGFEEAEGEGKNLALQDIRFSRTINRIQQSILQELNKIAILHLYLLGFEDDLDNFTLTLNNPSTQAEMLKIEFLQQKITAYKDAVADAGNGFGAMSMTRAKKEIMNMSDDDIRQDLLEQRMEKAAAAELENTSEVIKHTGIYNEVDRIYGDMEAARQGGSSEGEEGEEGESAGGGGGFGGGGISPEDFDVEEEGGEGEEGAEGGEEDLGALGAEEEGGEGEEGGEEGTEGEEGGGEEELETPAESELKKAEKLLKEHKNNYMNKLKHKKKKYRTSYVDKLVNTINPSDKEVKKRTKVYDKNLKINEDVNNMIGDIDNMTEEERNKLDD